MSKIKSQIESILFASQKPLSAKQLANLGIGRSKEITRAIENLLTEYKEQKRGIQITKTENKYQMATAGENAELVQGLARQELNSELSRPSLETLTIIAYRGPISKLDLERIRGINCGLILRNLLIRALIEENFHKQKNETYYTISPKFIRHLGLNTIEELPDYQRLSQDDTIDQVINNE